MSLLENEPLKLEENKLLDIINGADYNDDNLINLNEFEKMMIYF